MDLVQRFLITALDSPLFPFVSVKLTTLVFMNKCSKFNLNFYNLS